FGRTSDEYDGRVVAVAQMGLEGGMPLWYDYKEDVHQGPRSGRSATTLPDACLNAPAARMIAGEAGTL
ncbi:FAD-dependent pyridine nucleotide-disulfide oxidoreductase, partial [Alcaligenes faecalis subsp. faecalis NCIB 8687]